VGVVDERVIGEARNDRVFVLRVDRRDVLGDDSVKVGGGVHESLLGCRLKLGPSSERRVKDRRSR